MSEGTMERGKEATIHDIAAKSGVSIGTVSRALNNKPGVHPETRERVLAVSRELNVKSRAGARRKQVAILLHDTDALSTEIYAGALCSHLMVELSRNDMFGMFISSNEIDRLTREIFDGIVTTSWEDRDLDILRAIKSTPIVMARVCQNNHDFLLAGWNHRTEGELVAEYLINKGHRNIAMLHVDPGDPLSLDLRWQGFVDQAAKMGMELNPEQRMVYDSNARMVSLLKKTVDAEIDGLWMPGHQYRAVEGIKVLQEIFGLRIPRDISVIGSENEGFSELLQPSLTTVAAPLSDLAASIVDHLKTAMETGTSLTANEPIQLEPYLIERDSVGTRKA